MALPRNELKDTPNGYQSFTFRHQLFAEFLEHIYRPFPILVSSQLILNESFRVFFNLNSNDTVHFTEAHDYFCCKATPLANKQFATIDTIGNIKIWNASNPNKIELAREIDLPDVLKYGTQHWEMQPNFDILTFPDKRYFLIKPYHHNVIYFIDSLTGKSFFVGNPFTGYHIGRWEIRILNDGRVAGVLDAHNFKIVRLIKIDWQNKKTVEDKLNEIGESRFYQIGDNQYLIRMRTDLQYNMSPIPFSFTKKDTVINDLKIDGFPTAQLNSGEIVFIKYGNASEIINYSILHPSGVIQRKEFTTETSLRVCPGLGVFFLQKPDIIEFVGDAKLLYQLFELMKIEREELEKHLYPVLTDIVLDYMSSPKISLEDLNKSQFPLYKPEKDKPQSLLTKMSIWWHTSKDKQTEMKVEEIGGVKFHL